MLICSLCPQLRKFGKRAHEKKSAGENLQKLTPELHGVFRQGKELFLEWPGGEVEAAADDGEDDDRCASRAWERLIEQLEVFP